ncbi:LOW QUALITY PROTEIN: hypothetical protein ACHAWO_001971 [Cyclotella atomus]|uniref:Uncharacterized protein n=1 Tax=Cyclotella atomus TaxID=382360 RepID=A0ABD3MM63_9STRA
MIYGQDTSYSSTSKYMYSHDAIAAFESRYRKVYEFVSFESIPSPLEMLVTSKDINSNAKTSSLTVGGSITSIPRSCYFSRQRSKTQVQL